MRCNREAPARHAVPIPSGEAREAARIAASARMLVRWRVVVVESAEKNTGR